MKVFTIETWNWRNTYKNGKRVSVKQTLTLQIAVKVDGNIINLQYGYKEWWTQGVEGNDSVLPGQVYRLHNSIKPKQGDIWKHGNRVFEVGPIGGFVCYEAPLLENGRQVATIKFEDYYKD